jgi:hypothetical protein
MHGTKHRFGGGGAARKSHKVEFLSAFSSNCCFEVDFTREPSERGKKFIETRKRKTRKQQQEEENVKL